MSALGEKLRAWIVRTWPDLCLLGGLALSLSFSIEKAGWVANAGPIHGGIFLGALTGALLATTRWKGWQAGAYAWVLSLVAGAQWVGQILPSSSEAAALSLMQWAEGVRLRGLVFGLRLAGWVLSIQQGEKIQDTGLFLLLFSIVCWNGMVFLVWWAVRRRHPLPGLIPVGFLMAVNVHLARLERVHLFYFLVLAVCLVARGGYMAQKAEWRHRRVDYAEDLGLDWGTSGVLTAVMIGMVALVFSLVGSPEGWRVLSEWVQRSRAEVSETAEQWFGGVRPPPPAEDNFSGKERIRLPDLGEIGAPLPQGNETIFTVKISDPPPLPDSIRGMSPTMDVPRHYWRSQIFTAYTGRGWEAASARAIQTPVEPQEIPAGRYRLQQDYRFLARPQGDLFAVNEPVGGEDGITFWAVEPEGSLLVKGEVEGYTVVSWASRVTISQMENAPVEYPPAVVEYLQLPENIPQRVRWLTSEVVGEGTPYQKATKIQEYLRQNYRYDLAVSAAPPGWDVVDYFLFEARAGFCSHFASAMAVMLRLEGIPARVVSGYAMGWYDSRTGAYQVPASASHAWVEVFFPGLGWVEFEPTPAYEPFRYSTGQTEALPPSSAVEQTETGERKEVSPLIWLGGVFLLLAGVWGLFFWMHVQNLHGKKGEARAVQLYWRVRRELSRAGLAASGQLTPLEFFSNSRGRLEAYPTLQNAFHLVTMLYIRAIYSGHPPSIQEVRMGAWHWKNARRERVTFLFRSWFKVD